MNSKLKLGDSIIVKQGVKEPDLEELDIGGWQGRVVEINSIAVNDNILITIEWDSLTLEQIPPDYIEQSERDGFNWNRMTLYESELKKTKPRDKKENVKQIQDVLRKKHQWDGVGDEKKRITKILGNINPHDKMKCLQKWVEYLDNELTFPIHAIVIDSENERIFKCGDHVVIKSLPHIVDLYGIIASIKLKRKKYDIPLCDLEVIDKTVAEFQLIEDYRSWFFNG